MTLHFNYLKTLQSPTRSAVQKLRSPQLQLLALAVSTTLAPSAWAECPKTEVTENSETKLAILFGGTDNFGKPITERYMNRSNTILSKFLKNRGWTLVDSYYGEFHPTKPDPLVTAEAKAAAKKAKEADERQNSENECREGSKAHLIQQLQNACKQIAPGGQFLLNIQTHGKPIKEKTEESEKIAHSISLRNGTYLPVDDTELLAPIECMVKKEIRIAVIDQSCYSGSGVEVFSNYGCTLTLQNDAMTAPNTQNFSGISQLIAEMQRLRVEKNSKIEPSAPSLSDVCTYSLAHAADFVQNPAPYPFCSDSPSINNFARGLKEELPPNEKASAMAWEAHERQVSPKTDAELLRSMKNGLTPAERKFLAFLNIKDSLKKALKSEDPVAPASLINLYRAHVYIDEKLKRRDSGGEPTACEDFKL